MPIQVGQGVQAAALDPETGKISLLSTSTLGPNPAFVLRHPTSNVLYVSMERIDRNGEISVVEVGEKGKLKTKSTVDAGGKSTCFLNIPKDSR